jgi:hypothetical protein
MAIFGRSFRTTQARSNKGPAPGGSSKLSIETQFFPAMRGQMSLRAQPSCAMQTLIFPAMMGAMSITPAGEAATFVSLSGTVTV